MKSIAFDQIRREDVTNPTREEVNHQAESAVHTLKRRIQQLEVALLNGKMRANARARARVCVCVGCPPADLPAGRLLSYLPGWLAACLAACLPACMAGYLPAMSQSGKVSGRGQPTGKLKETKIKGH